MRDISRRIKNVENRLNLSEKSITITIVLFGGELPPDRKEAGINVHFELYKEEAIQ
jgi:hypothetical protein